VRQFLADWSTTMTLTNRQWLLKRRPQGALAEGDFELREIEMPETEPAAGEILVRYVAFLCAPTMRNWMDAPGNSLYPSVPLGEPVLAPAVGRVVASGDPKFPVGSRVFTLGSWQDYALINTTGFLPVSPLAEGVSFIDSLGRYGLNPLTGYFGLLEVGQAQSGQTLVVSGAAGSTGSTAAQIGRIKGMRVIGIAGGAAKCAWLTEQCGIDAAIDYKTENVEERLAALCPKGIDVYYDNVGGDILQAAVNNMANGGRIVLCGQISSYETEEQAEGPRNMMRLIYGSITMQGFLCSNYAAQFGQAIADLRIWMDAGELHYREDVRGGFEQLPDIFSALFDGSNNGTLIAMIDDSAHETA
jgi:NADPH-dependent curcumin reductase CurA